MQGQQAAASGAFSWVVSYAFRSVFWRGLDNLSRLPADRAGKVLSRLGFYRPKCVDRRYLFRCRSASFFRRIRTAQSGQYFARLDFGVNTAPHTAQRFTSSRLLLISAHRAASSSELAMVKSVRKNAQPQIENLCSKGAWGTSHNKRVGLSG